MNISPSQQEFLKLTQKGNLIPVYREILGDMDTPVSAFYKLAEKSQYSFLLESVEGEEKVARFSFLAKDPQMVIRSQAQTIEITHFDGKKKRKEQHAFKDSPLSVVRKIMSEFKFVNRPDLPPFCGGLVGSIGYDTVRFFEHLPNKPPDDVQMPDILLMMAKEFIIFDHRNHTIKIVCCASVPKNMTKKGKLEVYRKALAKIEVLVKEAQSTVRKKQDVSKTNALGLKVRSNISRPAFKDIVNKAKEEIYRGEIIQTVLSQRFETDLKTTPFEIYRMLRALNPSPYMYYLSFDDIQIVGSSPELLVRCEDGVVETRPIAGTRPRGKNNQEDDKLAEELLADPKEKAEHIMLVDLGRNDLGRVCRQGTVQVTDFMLVERYSHVMHIVSNVQGRLQKGKDAFDVLKATFPAGTVSGAPKIRAMEIIDELETTSRGAYAGCIGYFSFSGNFDSCITIRTIVIVKGKAYIQAGAGIVADSDPEKEYVETVNKAKAQIKAIEQAHHLFA